MTGEVIWRDVIEADLPIFYEHQLDPEATRMAAFPSRNQEPFMAHWNRILADEAVTLKAILYDGQVAGNMVSFEQAGQREVGYWLGRAYWSQGIATRALAEFLNQVTARPLYAHVAQQNIASLRVLEKCGFTIIGEDAGFSADPGERVDEFILQLAAEDKVAAPG